MDIGKQRSAHSSARFFFAMHAITTSKPLLSELLIIAAKNSWCSVIRCLIAECHVSASYQQYKSLRTPLHTAAYFDQPEAVRTLIEHGANLESQEAAWLQTPLLVAVQRASLPTVKLLVEAGADLHASDKDSWSIRTFLRYSRLLPDISAYITSQNINREL
jgi:ankyrin repeat protein